MDNFVGIDLHDTFVLSWCVQDSVLEFDLEASIWPKSQYYSKPKLDEFTCYKKAKLRFLSISSIEGLRSLDDVDFSTDINGEKDYGNIDHLEKTASGFLIEGDFGVVVIENEGIEFEIKT